MSNHKLKSMKSETCYRLIPTLMFIIAITGVILTMFFMFVLQSGITYQADIENFVDDILADNDNFKYDVIHGKLDDNAHIKLTYTEFEDNQPIPSTPKSPIQTDSSLATFMLKKTIIPTINNNIKTNNNLRNLKAYKIVSKDPIMENSLVKIVMAPQTVLEKLSKQNGNLKYADDKIDEIANGSIKYNNENGAIDRELIRIRNGNENIDDFDISWEKEQNVNSRKTIQSNGIHEASNNIQIITKPNKQRRINVHSNGGNVEREISTPTATVGRDLGNVNEMIVNVRMESAEQNTKIELNSEEASPSTIIHDNESNLADVDFDDDIFISNSQSSEIESEDVRENASTENETNSNNYRTALEQMLSSTTDASHMIQVTPQESSTNDDVPLILMREETNSQPALDSSSPSQNIKNVASNVNISPPSSSPAPFISVENVVDQVSIESSSDTDVKIPAMPATPAIQSIPAMPAKSKSSPANKRIVTRPSTTTMTPLIIDTKEKKFPKKVSSADTYNKYKKLSKFDDDSSTDFTPNQNLLEIDDTNPPAQSESKLNIKRAIGDEGTFSNIVRPTPIQNNKLPIGDQGTFPSIVRPSPMSPKLFENYLPNETSAERADRINKSLKRLMYFVHVVGQVDSYLTNRFRSGLKTVARMFDSDEETRRRRSNL